MKKILAFLLLLPFTALAQEKLIKDLDGDAVNDTAYVDAEQSVIVCRLSGNGFRPVQSKPIETLNEQSGLSDARNGFTFYNDWMRSGYKCQFRYDAAARRMRLIGMSRYEFGNAANDGSGESSVNLITGDYSGKWNYADIESGKLNELPVIKTKMIFPKIYLEAFNDAVFDDYASRCSGLYEKQKNLAIKKGHH